MAEVIGKYTVESTVARGFVATIHRAVDPLLGRPLAVKVIDLTRADNPADARTRLRARAAAAARLTLAGVTPLIDYIENGDSVTVVSPWQDGESLRDLVAASGPLPAERAVAIARQILTVLAQGHAKGVPHGGLTPGNVLVHAGPQGADTVTVCDYGTAVSGMPGFIGATLASDLGYLAPERILDGTPAAATPASDIFAVAMLVRFMVTGSAPLAGNSAQGLDTLLNGDGPLLPATGDGALALLAPVLATAVARAPDQRPATAEAFAQALASCIPAAKHAAPPVPTPGPQAEPAAHAADPEDVTVLGGFKTTNAAPATVREEEASPPAPATPFAAVPFTPDPVPQPPAGHGHAIEDDEEEDAPPSRLVQVGGSVAIVVVILIGVSVLLRNLGLLPGSPDPALIAAAEQSAPAGPAGPSPIAASDDFLDSMASDAADSLFGDSTGDLAGGLGDGMNDMAANALSGLNLDGAAGALEPLEAATQPSAGPVGTLIGRQVLVVEEQGAHILTDSPLVRSVATSLDSAGVQAVIAADADPSIPDRLPQAALAGLTGGALASASPALRTVEHIVMVRESGDVLLVDAATWSIDTGLTLEDIEAAGR